jgi:hypothetical protein
MKKLIGFLLIAIIGIACTNKKEIASMEPPLLAPFENIDTLATNDWWNRGPSRIIDMKVERKDVIAFGIYTVQTMF